MTDRSRSSNARQHRPVVFPGDDEVRRWFECERKVAFQSEPDALVRVREAHDDRVRAYPCPHCRQWHVGHPAAQRTPSDQRHKMRMRWLAEQRRQAAPAAADVTDSA